MYILLPALVLVSVIIILAASRLAVYADVIADRFQISRSWIGLVFVSIVTTLPEATVTISALTQIGRPDLALGNNFGSILFNLNVIALADIFCRHGGILRKTRENNALPVACAMAMLVLVMGMLLFPLPLKLGPIHVGAGALASIVAFGALFRLMQKFEAREIIPATPQPAPRLGGRISHPVIGFAVCALLVIGGAAVLANLGDRLAEALNLRHSFVGFILLAGITSLPELTFGIAAVRIGAYDLLLGNVIGASMINMLVIASADLIHWRAVLSAPETVGMDQVLTGLLAMLALALILIGIINRQGSAKPRRVAGITSRMLLALYILGAVATYFGFG